MSAVNLLVILPIGVVSKVLIGHFIKLINNLEYKLLEAFKIAFTRNIFPSKLQHTTIARIVKIKYVFVDNAS